MSVRSVEHMLNSVSPETESLRRETRELRALLREASIGEGQIKEAVSAVAKAMAHVRPISLPEKPRGRGPGKPVSLVAHFTDWHIGQRTPEAAVEGFNSFDWAIAQRRIGLLVSSLKRFAKTVGGGYRLDECVVLCTGDYISGDIHEGLIRTNEFPAPVQAVRAGLLMASAIRSLAGAFPSVRVEFIAPGNHDRLTKKPQAQGGGYNSWGFVVGSLTQEALREVPNVSFNLHPVMQTLVTVRGRRYLIGHGDGIIGTWGIPFYGVERKSQREAVARLNMADEHRFHRIVIGHFHTATDHEHWLIGGSLSGTDENDHKQGRHSPAHQTSWLVHPDHPEFGFTRWYL